MADCSKCKFDDDQHCIGCENGSNFEHMTNADRIRSMTDKKMSTDLIPLIMEVCEDGVPCDELFLQWLQSEAE